MIVASEWLAEAVTAGSAKTAYVADLVVDGQIVLPNYGLEQGELVSDTTAKIVTQGNATFNYSDELGQTIVPSEMTSWLSPFASFLDISYRVSVGTQSEKVLRGRMKITGVSDPQERNIAFQDRLLTVGSSVRLKLKDLFHTTDRERFTAPSGPRDLSSTWKEMGRLTGLPLHRTVPDKSITRQVTYDENRLDAVIDLASILDGTPYVDPLGALAIAPNAWGDPVASLVTGSRGTVSRVDPDDLSDDRVYNQVVVRSWDDQQATVLATSEVTAGPLRYGGPFGRVPYFASAQYITTEAQAKAYAASMLPKVSALPALTYSIQHMPDPRLEVWDVVSFEYRGRMLDGRIQKITLPGTGLQTTVVGVQR